MKFQVSFKTLDAVEYAVKDAMDYEDIPTTEDFDERKEEIMDIVSKWVEYGECITVEFDTDEGTAKVIEA